MSQSSAASDPLYHDVSPVYERYTKMFLMISALVCLASMVCALIQAQQDTQFYVIILSLFLSLVFVICIFLFFKRRILLAEKLWFVNLTIFILFLQALIFLIFVFIRPYPVPTTTTPITTRMTTRFTTTSPNHTNGSNLTTTTTRRTTTTTKKQFLREKQYILTKLYELDET